jgi:large subunit ribosomal protein L21
MRIKNKEIRKRRKRKEEKIKEAKREQLATYEANKASGGAAKAKPAAKKADGEKKPAARKAAPKAEGDSGEKPKRTAKKKTEDAPAEAGAETSE